MAKAAMVQEAWAKVALDLEGVEVSAVMAKVDLEGLEVSEVTAKVACQSGRLPRASSLDSRTTVLLLDTLAHQTWCQWYLQIHTLNHNVRKNRQTGDPVNTHQTHRESSTRRMHQCSHFLFHLSILCQRHYHEDCTNSCNLCGHQAHHYDQCQ
jgi:hypothetical protein